MKLVEIEVKIGLIKKELAHWEGIYTDRRCVKCENFNRICTLAGIEPPPEVMPIGCPEWVFDGVPF